MTPMTWPEFKAMQKAKKARKKVHGLENAKLNAFGIAQDPPNPGSGSIRKQKMPRSTPKLTAVKFERNRAISKNALEIGRKSHCGLNQAVEEMPWRYWRDKADDMWSQAVKMLAKRVGITLCRHCMSNLGNTACHIIPRGKYATRFLLSNGYIGCGPCNNGERWHRLDYREHHIQMIGAAQYESLVWISKHGKSKFDRNEMRQIYEALKKVVEGGSIEEYELTFGMI